jgi:hypothetical protein
MCHEAWGRRWSRCLAWCVLVQENFPSRYKDARAETFLKDDAKKDYLPDSDVVASQQVRNEYFGGAKKQW